LVTSRRNTDTHGSPEPPTRDADASGPARTTHVDAETAEPRIPAVVGRPRAVQCGCRAVVGGTARGRAGVDPL